MSHPIMAIDKSLDVFQREQAEWENCGASMVRMDSMSEAMDHLHRGTFLFIVINADNISFLPILPIMREITIAPIFIFTSKFNVHDLVRAYHNGADAYVPFQKNPEENVMSAKALLHRYSEQRRRFYTTQGNTNHGILAVGNILVVENHYRVFVSDNTVHLTPTEFKILALLMKNRKRIFTYNNLLCEAWGEEYEDSSHNLVWHQVKKLKKKLRAAPNELEYIVNIHGIGYRFDP